MFGLSESDKETLEQKLLGLCNNHLKLQSLIVAEITHYLGNPPPKSLPPQQPAKTNNDTAVSVAGETATSITTTSQAPPWAILIKLDSRGTMGKIMDDQRKDWSKAIVLFRDDLTKRRATWLSMCNNEREMYLSKTQWSQIARFKWKTITVVSPRKLRPGKIPPKVKCQ